MTMHMLSADKLLSSGVLEKAETLLQAALEKEPRNIVMLERLGEICRQLGKFKKAGEVFDRLSKLDPSSVKAAYLAAIMNQRQFLSEPPQEGAVPSPFFIKENFLPQPLHDDLLNFAIENEEKFTPSPCLTKEMGWAVRTEFRNASQFPLTVELMDRLWAFVEPLLADICAHLHVQNLPERKNPWNIQYYGDGCYTRRHRDDVGGGHRVTMLYYFCSPQRAFTGGNFLLYDKNASNGSAIPNRFTGIPFADNVLAAFPSERSHEATNIHCPEKGIRYGRLAVPIHLG